MITIETGSPVPSVETCIGILTHHNSLMGIPINYDRLLEYYSYYSIKSSDAKRRIANYIHVKPEEVNRNTIASLIKRSNANNSLFLKTEKGDLSVSSDSINLAIETGRVPKEIEAILKVWSTAYEASTMASSLRSIVLGYKNKILPFESYDNCRMIFVKPTWVGQNTGRLGMQNPAMQNINKLLKDIETVPKGWIHFETDSGQIEPRIAQSMLINDPVLRKCTIAYNDAYYGYIHYCTVLTDAERRNPDTVIVPLELSDEMIAKRKKFKTYGNGVLYGSEENKDNDIYKAAFIKYIGKHPNRIKKQAEVAAKIDRGNYIFETAFGTKIDVTQGGSDEKKRERGEEAYRNHLINCGINAPMQGTAGDLMRVSVVRAHMLLGQKAPNSVILKYVHDAGYFAIHEDDYDKVIDELKEITSYQVDDWIPIYGEGKEGFEQSGDLPRLTR